MNFDAAVECVLEHEGGYVNDPDDPGGETKYGISKRAYPDLVIADLTKDDARAIYRRDYWEAPKINLLPDSVHAHVFDMAVNAGPSRAVRLLQEAVNAFRAGPISVDGEIGPVTVRAASDVRDDALEWAYLAKRCDHYIRLAERRPSSKKYLRGWLKRAFSYL